MVNLWIYVVRRGVAIKKIVLLGFVCVCIILFVSFNKYISLNINLNQTETTQSKIAPNPIYVEGNSIKEANTNKSIQLKGVSTMAFVSYRYKEEELLRILDFVKKWNINILGLFVNPDDLKGQEMLLARVVDWAEENHIYVYIMPAVNIRDIDKSEMKQVAEFPQMMKSLAEQYRKRTHILYGLWAEPRYLIWPVWKVQAQEIESQILRSNPNATILFTGVQYGRYFDTSEVFLKSKNIIYDFHDYPASNKDELSSVLQIKTDFLWSSLVNKYPVFIGEFGGVYKQDFSSPEDLVYIQKVLDNINNYKLHYTAYTVDDEDGLGLIDWTTGLPTKKGELIKNDLHKFPPTKFSD